MLDKSFNHLAPTGVAARAMFTARHALVGHFSSIPWIPNYVSAEGWPMDLVTCESSEVRSLTQQGALAFTPMAVADWFALRADWRRVGSWGIAYRGQAGSVRLFSQVPIEQLDGADIAVCDETTTSVRVLEVILKEKYGMDIGAWRRNVDPSDSTTPRLLIQNQAFEESSRRRFAHCYDLGEEWWHWQGTPIVSAVWVGEATLPDADVAAMEARLHNSMALYQQDPLRAIELHLKRHKLMLDTRAVRALHGNFEYLLGTECERGIQRMEELLPAEVEGFRNAANASTA